MAQSRLNSTLRYTEPEGGAAAVHAADKGHRCPLYQVSIPLTGLDHRIALGKISLDMRASHHVAYFRIYLMGADGRPARWIGVYEIKDTEIQEVVVQEAGGAAGPYQLEERDPLIFESVTGEYLRGIAEAIDAAQVQEEPTAAMNKTAAAMRLAAPMAATGPGPAEPAKRPRVDANAAAAASSHSAGRITRYNIFEASATSAALLAVQQPPRSAPAVDLKSLRAQDDREKAAYRPSPTDNWIRKFMKSASYEITENAGGGDCLLLAVVAAYKGAGLKTSVAKLRALLAQEVTSGVFENYRTIYTNYRNDITAEKRKARYLKDEYSAKNALLRAGTLSQPELDAITADALRIKAQYDAAKAEVDATTELIQEFNHMRHVTTLDEFRAHVQTSDFWSDEATIKILEESLRLKIVVLRLLQDDDTSSVLQGGHDYDSSKFEPLHYVVVEHSPKHYRLVSVATTASRTTLFTFDQLPAGIKLLAVDKCNEHIGDGYAKIPEFRQLMDQEPRCAAAAAAAAAHSRLPPHTVDLLHDDDSSSDEEKKKGEEEPPLFNPNVLFRISAGSANTAPGKTTGERLPARLRSKFVALEKYEHWRRKLDDAWTEAPFSVPGDGDGAPLRWASVVHYLVAAPLRSTNESAYRALSLDGNSALSTDAALALKTITGVAATEKRKATLGMYQKDYERGIPKVDLDVLRMAALRAKFGQNVDLRTVLLHTLDSELHVVARGKEPVSDTLLMRVRAELKAATV